MAKWQNVSYFLEEKAGYEITLYRYCHSWTKVQVVYIESWWRLVRSLILRLDRFFEKEWVEPKMKLRFPYITVTLAQMALAYFVLNECSASMEFRRYGLGMLDLSDLIGVR